MIDPRTDLEKLPSEKLVDIARNEAAAHRVLAIRLLIERGSSLALQPEIADEARELVLNDPIILKQIDAATAIVSLKLPGIVDVLAENSKKRAELAELVDEHHATGTRKLAALEATVNNNHAATAQSLADETGALGQAFIDGHRQLKQNFERQIAALGSTVTANKAASDLALRDACAGLWNDFTGKMFRLTQERDAQKTNFDGQIAALQASHTKETHVASVRLALLERSLWRKLVDYFKPAFQMCRVSDRRAPRRPVSVTRP
jgi:hypothetical protein